MGDNPGKVIYTKRCRQCDNEFHTHAKNKLYCPECATERKINSDAVSWQGRKARHKRKLYEMSHQKTPEQIEIAELEKILAQRMKLPYGYFCLWRRDNPVLYAEQLEQLRRERET